MLVQIVVPSREKVDGYADLRCEIERRVGEINGRHSLPGAPALHYVYGSLPPEKLISHYLAGDVMVVTSLRDGMNLVAKEFIASRTEDDGVLILSEFAGAARELREAMIVNPYDPDGLAQAMEDAVRMPITAQRQAVQAMRARLRRHDVYRWAARFLRRLDRISVTLEPSVLKLAGTPDHPAGRPGRDHQTPALPATRFDPAASTIKGVG
jgi:trehalose 6-phosphate synthase